jgi:hypothetical protein
MRGKMPGERPNAPPGVDQFRVFSGGRWATYESGSMFNVRMMLG